MAGQFKKLDMLGILKLWNESEGNLKKMAESLGIVEQIPDLIASIPPEVCQVIAGLLAPHLPAPTVEVNEIAKATVNILLPLLQDEVKKMGAGTGGTVDNDKLAALAAERLTPFIEDQIKKIPPVSPDNIKQIADIVRGNMALQYSGTNAEMKAQLTELAASLKTMQDESEAKTRQIVSVTFQAEVAKARAAQVAAHAANPGTVDESGHAVTEPTPQGAYATTMAIINALISALPAVADAYSKFRPAASANLGELALKAYISGLTQGNKLRVGEVKPEDVAQTALDTIFPKPAAKA